MSGEERSEKLQAFKTGDRQAVDHLWEEYQQRLLALARRKLGMGHSRVSDEEDVAISAFTSMVRLANEGKLENVAEPEDLWNLLATITVRKVFARIKYNRAAKRGGGTVRGESVFLNAHDPSESPGIGQIRGEQLPPDAEVIADEECRVLLAQLDDSQREIALLKMEGYTNEEIAERLQCSTRRVTRKLALIRECWSGEETS
jgi:RNA polymerase sigma factor (sigma-70 family)